MQPLPCSTTRVNLARLELARRFPSSLLLVLIMRPVAWVAAACIMPRCELHYLHRIPLEQGLDPVFLDYYVDF